MTVCVSILEELMESIMSWIELIKRLKNEKDEIISQENLIKSELGIK